LARAVIVIHVEGSVMEKDQTTMLPAILPLFPLPQVVLFPHTLCPLHIFEPRYREMIETCLSEHGHFILVMSKHHQGGDLVPAQQSFFEIGTLASIVHAESLPDGRWNLLVQGERAVRLSGEIGGRSYRQVHWEACVWDADAPLDSGLFERLLISTKAFAAKHDIDAQLQELLQMDLAPKQLLNTLALAMDFQAIEKQFLLEASSLDELADRLSQLLQFALSDRIIE
jgi:uncharacterized protein